MFDTFLHCASRVVATLHNGLWFVLTALLLVLGGVVASIATTSTALWVVSIVVIAALLTQQFAPGLCVTTRWFDAVRRTLCYSLLIWGFVGLTMFVGPAAVLLAVLVVASAPPRLSLLVRLTARFRRLSSAAPGVGVAGQAELRTPFHDDLGTSVLVAVAADTRAVAQLTALELCSAWRRSFLALERHRSAGTMASQAALIGLRQLYLDELERRDPVGFARWIASGARPASDPSRYLTWKPRP